MAPYITILFYRYSNSIRQCVKTRGIMNERRDILSTRFENVENFEIRLFANNDLR